MPVLLQPVSRLVNLFISKVLIPSDAALEITFDFSRIMTVECGPSKTSYLLVRAHGTGPAHISLGIFFPSFMLLVYIAASKE